MNNHQANQVNIHSVTPTVFQSVSQMLGNLSKIIYSPWASVSHSRNLAMLDPSIQYDIGELDYRPQAFPSHASQTPQEASLERMLLRSV